MRLMKLTRKQVETLKRYPRATKIWSAAGIKLTPRTRVHVDPNGRVRLVQPQNDR